MDARRYASYVQLVGDLRERALDDLDPGACELLCDTVEALLLTPAGELARAEELLGTASLTLKFLADEKTLSPRAADWVWRRLLGASPGRAGVRNRRRQSELAVKRLQAPEGTAAPTLPLRAH